MQIFILKSTVYKKTKVQLC